MSYSYSIVQFSPLPERFEYLNAGVFVWNSPDRTSTMRFTNDFRRFSQQFGQINGTFLRHALVDFGQRLSSFTYDARELGYKLQEFESIRGDNFRMTPLQYVTGDNLNSIADHLFEELVLFRAARKKVPSFHKFLDFRLNRLGVLNLLDVKPAAIDIPKYGIRLQADYGYQNGVYNLIDGMKFETPQRGISEIGKRVLEGRALHEMGKRLVVVGDFGDQPDSLIGTFRQEFKNAHARLYRIEELEDLSAEIKKAAA